MSSRDRSMFLCLVLTIFYLIVVNGKSEEARHKCEQTAKVESYLDTVSDMIGKIKENLPAEGSDVCGCPTRPMDCGEIMKCGNNRSGVYEIWPRNRIMTKSIQVYCEMDIDGGGWTVIQKRGDYKRPKDFFYKSWQQYKNGFGDVRRDFWLGNDIIHALTNQNKYYLRFDLEDVENNTRYAIYDQFWIENENQKYKLHVYDYSGDAGDSFAAGHNGYFFSTFDQDNDNYTENCALTFKGGWWYTSCHSSNLNGYYLNGTHESYADGVNWHTFKGLHESLKTTEMKIRPVDFRASAFDMTVEPK